MAMILTFLIVTVINFFVLGIFTLPLIILFDFSARAKIISIAICFLISCGFSTLLCNSVGKETKEWNEGFCPQCGEEWELFDVERTGRYGQYEYYYYICNNCGNTTRQTGG